MQPLRSGCTESGLKKGGTGRLRLRLFLKMIVNSTMNKLTYLAFIVSTEKMFYKIKIFNSHQLLVATVFGGCFVLRKKREKAWGIFLLILWEAAWIQEQKKPGDILRWN